MTRNYKKIAAVILMSLMLVNTQVFANKIDGRHEASKAADIAKIKVKNSPKGFFFRGDSRPPKADGGRGIFVTGFEPQGTNPDLNAHLSFRGDSAYVSTSRSDIAAQMYMFGRSSEHHSEGYLYVIGPDDLNEGYWIPGIYRNDQAVQRNQEFAHYGAIEASHIAGAFHYSAGNNNPIEWIPNPNYLYGLYSPYNPSRDNYFQDICRAVTAVAAYLCFKPHPQP